MDAGVKLPQIHFFFATRIYHRHYSGMGVMTHQDRSVVKKVHRESLQRVEKLNILVSILDVFQQAAKVTSFLPPPDHSRNGWGPVICYLHHWRCG